MSTQTTTIVTKITDSIQAAVTIPSASPSRVVSDPIPVYYHDLPTLNAMASGMSLPCAYFELLGTGRADLAGGTAREVVTAAVFFVEKTEFDFDAVENEEIIQRCKERAFAWLLSLNRSDTVSVVRVGNTSRVYEQLDDIVTGFGVSVDLVENVGVCA